MTPAATSGLFDRLATFPSYVMSSYKKSQLQDMAQHQKGCAKHSSVQEPPVRLLQPGKLAVQLENSKLFGPPGFGPDDRP